MVMLECYTSWVLARWGKTKNYKIGICCFSTNNPALGSKNKDWLWLRIRIMFL